MFSERWSKSRDNSRHDQEREKLAASMRGSDSPLHHVLAYAAGAHALSPTSDI